MEDHWYSNQEVLGSSPGPVQFSLPIFQIKKWDDEGSRDNVDDNEDDTDKDN